MYSFPDEWRTADELNAGVFGFTGSFLGEDIPGGRPFARELTEKEKRELEE